MAQVEVDPTLDTEFHDALRAHGIIPPKPPSRPPSPDRPSASETRSAQLSALPLHQIERALNEGLDGRSGSGSAGAGGEARGDRARDQDEDEDEVDAELGKLDEEEERILLGLRAQRMREMREKQRTARFGRVYPISRPDYMREVTEASKEEYGSDALDEQESAAATRRSDGEGANAAESGRRKGTGVVCFLYKDGLPECQLVARYLDTLAAKYPSSKFVSIVGDQCIPNYPDKNLPTMLIYRGGELHRQIVGLRPEIGLDGMKTRCADIELLLVAVGALVRSEAVEDRSAPTAADLGEGEEQEQEQLDDSEKRRGGIRQGTGTGIGAAGRKATTVKTQEEEDAELDWDL